MKLRIFNDIYHYTFSKKNIFAAARMRFIFVTRCAGNKDLFFGLNSIVYQYQYSKQIFVG